MKTWVKQLAPSILVCMMAAHANAASFNTELLINGGAEAGDTSGWLTTGIDAVSSALALSSPPGVSIGSFSFTGGTGATSQSLTQTVNVADLASIIDAGHAVSSFDVLAQARRLGGAFDSATGTLSFLNASNVAIQSHAFLDTLATSGIYDWEVISLLHTLPTGTRAIEIFLNTTRNAGEFNDGFFDNASLKLANVAPVPVPGTYSMMLAGLGLLGLTMRRRRTNNA